MESLCICGWQIINLVLTSSWKRISNISHKAWISCWSRFFEDKEVKDSLWQITPISPKQKPSLLNPLMMFLPCRQNLGRRAHRTAVLCDGSWGLWHSHSAAWSLGPLALQFTFHPTSPSLVSSWLICLAQSTEAGASMWQSCTETPQSCSKLSCAPFAPALFADPAQVRSPAELSSAISGRLFLSEAQAVRELGLPQLRF